MPVKSVGVRLVAEFLIVFTGVVGALLADDWRERRSERRIAQEGLAQIQVDLDLESAEYQALFESVGQQERAAAWLIVNLERPGVPTDSVAEAMRTVTVGRIFEPAGPAYQSLRDGGNLHLLEDPALRREIVRYYEDTQTYLAELDTRVEEVSHEVERRLVRYRKLLPRAGSLEFGPGARWDLTATPAAIARDGELVSAIGLFGGRASFLSTRLEAFFIPENSRLRGLIAEALDGG